LKKENGERGEGNRRRRRKRGEGKGSYEEGEEGMLSFPLLLLTIGFLI